MQVLKEGINTKGPTLTSYLSIPGRYLVMLPDMDRTGVSRRVEDEELRREMKKTLDQLELPEGFGFILRTAGIGRGKMELKRDLAYLLRLWKDIERRRKAGASGGSAASKLLYAESDLLMRSLRDFWTTDIDEIIVDNDAALRRAGRFMKIVSPRSATRLLHYERPAPVFHAFGIEEQIAQMHSREVPLASGGYLVIDETEAMIAIDVNSGKMRNAGDAETTAFRTNTEAVDEICRQLRLRDVGGLVLCDLIDMSKREHRRDIEHRFREHLKSDRAATKVLPISQFGIVEMTRQRQRGSLRSAHYAKCPSCHGRGLLQRPDSVAADALRELGVLLDQPKVGKVEMVVSQSVAGVLLSSKRRSLGRLEHHSKKRVDVRISADVGLDRVVFYAYDESGADLELDKMPRAKPPKDLPEWKDAGPAADWSVDTLSETHSATDDEMWREQEAVPADQEPLLVDISDEDLEAAEAMVGAPASARPAAMLAPARESGKRGRRRRGRGRDKGDDADEMAPPARERGPKPVSGRAPAPIQPAPAPVPSGPMPPRGDSWDLDPSQLTMVRAQPEHAPATPTNDMEEGDADPSFDGHAEHGPGADPAAPAGENGGKKRRRGRRGGRRRRKGGPEGAAGGAPVGPQTSSPNAGSEASGSDEVAGDGPMDDAPAPNGDSGPSEGTGEGQGKRRRRRRRGKGRREDGAESSGSPAPKSQQQPRNKPAAPRESTSRTAPRPAAPPPPAPAPSFRTLYGNRRRLNPLDASARRGRDE